MEGLAPALDILKKVSSKSKNAEIHLAVGELKSVLTILKSSSAPSEDLFQIFRTKVAPLYVAFPTPMCQFAAAVLSAIFEAKIAPACKAGDLSLQFHWELVQKCVVTSVLDFLDDRPSEANKIAVANALHKTICSMFFRTQPSFKWTCISLLSNVTQLLTDTATKVSDIQSLLRTDKLLGAKRIGYALSQTRDYVVIDSLIYLIGPLLPARSAAAKRTAFVDALFTPAFFPNGVAEKIKKLIAASSALDWDPVATRIVNECLAGDLSYPQPFHITALRTDPPQPNVVDPLFVDNQGVFANTEQAGLVDSYQIPFKTMDRIRLGPTAMGVSIRYHTAPRVGGDQSELDFGKGEKEGKGKGKEEETGGTMTFQLKSAADAARFVAVIKARGMSHLISDPKVSKIAEGGLSLEFNNNNNNSSGGPPPTQQEKVAKVEQLWHSHDDGAASQSEPTSPLVAQHPHHSSPPKSRPKPRPIPKAKAIIEASPNVSQEEHDAIYGEELSDMSDDGEEHESKAKAKGKGKAKSEVKAKGKSKAKAVRIADEGEEEEEGRSAPVAKKAAAARKNAMKKVESEGEEEGEEDEEVERPRKAAPRKSAMKKLAAVASEGEEEDEEQRPRKAAPRKSAMKKLAVVVSEGEEEDQDAPPRKPAPRKSATKKPAAAVESEAEEEQEEVGASSAPSNAKDEDFVPTQSVFEDVVAPAQARITRAAPRKSTMKKLESEAQEEEEEGGASSVPSNAKDEDFVPTQDVVAPAPARVTRGAARKATGDGDAADEPEPAARSIRRAGARKPPPVADELSMSEAEDDDDMPARLMADAKPKAKPPVKASAKAKENSNADQDKRPDKATTKAVKVANKPAPEDARSGRKRVKVDDDEDDQDRAEDADVDDYRPTKRLRETTMADEEPGPALPRSDSALVFGTVKPLPPKKRYGGKKEKGRTSSPGPDTPDSDDDAAMAVDYDEPPAAPRKVAVKAGKGVGVKKVVVAAKPEPDARKGRVAAMKDKAGQTVVGKAVPAAKAAPKSKAAPAGKNKSKVQDEDDIEVVSDEEVKPVRRATRSTKADVPSKAIVPVVEQVPRPKPKPKQELKKPRKAPWEDMHLKKKDDADAVMHDAVISDTFEEYDVPLKGSASSDPQDDVIMLDLTHDDTPPKAKKLQLDDIVPALPPDFASALDSAFALHADPTSALDSLPVDPAPVLTAASPRPPPFIARPESNAKPATAQVALASTPTRSQTYSSPVPESEPVLPLAMSKFKSEAPSRPQKTITPSPIRPAKLPSPVRQPANAKPEPMKKLPIPSPPPVPQAPPPRSPAPAAHRKVLDESPFPQRVHQSVAFAPSRASPSPVQRKAAYSGRMPNNSGAWSSLAAYLTTTTKTAYEPTPDLGRPARTFGRVPLQPKHKADRDHDYSKRSHSPMQDIVEILNEIQTVVVANISQRMDRVKSDVRTGRESILRGAAANLESMCAESEAHFNTLVDLEEEYSAYHRKIIAGWDDMKKSTEAMSDVLGQVIQHHDRRSLSKKLPTTMFTVPAILRKPISL
ncbi:hypothetical protein C8R46DRAFT_1363623 [Mycena filopes]|nr:hypothetical protein C8R46DRAFT_1363623 [Mycena filopes]